MKIVSENELKRREKEKQYFLRDEKIRFDEIEK